jgi:hypothetical protein
MDDPPLFFPTTDKMVGMPSKSPSGPVLGQHPIAPLIMILAIIVVCCLSVVGSLLKNWLGR